MRLVYWGRKQVSEHRTEGAMNEFRAALTKWNDNLNRNLALAYRYFGATFGGFERRLIRGGRRHWPPPRRSLPKPTRAGPAGRGSSAPVHQRKDPPSSYLDELPFSS
jgi:hypothetical protein